MQFSGKTYYGIILIIKLTTMQSGDENNNILLFQLCIKATTQLPITVIYKDKNPRPPACMKEEKTMKTKHLVEPELRKEEIF